MDEEYTINDLLSMLYKYKRAAMDSAVAELNSVNSEYDKSQRAIYRRDHEMNQDMMLSYEKTIRTFIENVYQFSEKPVVEKAVDIDWLKHLFLHSALPADVPPISEEIIDTLDYYFYLVPKMEIDGEGDVYGFFKDLNE